MEFNKLVKEMILPLLQDEGFQIAEEFTNVIRFESSIMKVNLVYNEMDKSNFIEIGRIGETLYSLNDNVIKNIFNTELCINQVTPDIFLRNLCIIFQLKDGIEVLRGKINKLVEFKEQESYNYTYDLIQRQTLRKASKAWENKDYQGYVNCIDEIDIEKIPISYKLKYKIAKKNL